MLAVMKFFLGQDRDPDGDASDGEDADEDGPGAHKPTAPSKEDVYKAYNKVGGGGRRGLGGPSGGEEIWEFQVDLQFCTQGVRCEPWRSPLGRAERRAVEGAVLGRA